MQYNNRLYVSPIFRLVAQMYDPLLNEIPFGRDAEIQALDMTDDDGKEVIGAGIISDDDQYRVYLIAKEDEHSRLSVQYFMVTKEEDERLETRDLDGDSDIIELHDSVAFHLFLRRIANFLVHGVKPEVLGGEGE
jgi:hypothetical protein